MLISSADLLGTASIGAAKGASSINAALNDSNTMPLDSLDTALDELTLAIAETVLAYRGIRGRNPTFDEAAATADVQNVRDDLVRALGLYLPINF